MATANPTTIIASIIAVSSHRPFKNCSPEILKNQLRARESWENNFSYIVYFGPPEAALTSDKTIFIPCDGFPFIYQLVGLCAKQVGWYVILNADIVVPCDLFRVEQRLNTVGALACVSRRFEFTDDNLASGRIVDLGLDFFAAMPKVWEHALKLLPNHYRIGHCIWDTWMLGFLCEHYFERLWDITECRAVFHPQHGDRQRIFDIDQETGKEQLSQVRWPMNRMT